MIIIKRYWILLWVVLMGSVLKPRLPKCYRKSDTGMKTFAVQSTHKPPIDEIREEMA